MACAWGPAPWAVGHTTQSKSQLTQSDQASHKCDAGAGIWFKNICAQGHGFIQSHGDPCLHFQDLRQRGTAHMSTSHTLVDDYSQLLTLTRTASPSPTSRSSTSGSPGCSRGQENPEFFLSSSLASTSATYVRGWDSAASRSRARHTSTPSRAARQVGEARGHHRVPSNKTSRRTITLLKPTSTRSAPSTPTPPSALRDHA
jgi:hypothetical protein